MPSAEQVAAIFKPFADGNMGTFFDSIDDDVLWTVKGTFCPIANTYHSKKAFQDGTKPLTSTWATPLKLVVRNIISDGQNQAAIELEAVDTVCKNGLKFTNFYTWICTFGENGKIVKINAYMDTELVSKAIATNPA
ncbi:hypothetical protein BDV41DRAFT_72418 [Neofusicoccum parvum]|uniref:Uncharacterized protein n=1 Tax=Neofusicoccum parvum TaxID=310453 RepID=A0ACB5SLF2_9PEZI|nr:hypothetical protein BDV41DRAFT_72418 [Neofusicoccum parvum]GME65666.1 hypothetical protein BDV41DRAFT_72418 [Neofusicoccum parvum]